ncbi:MAG: hypothetical protein COB36_03335 [Alphaproteobacteria bacterium]|nr:MAG: hypothetical protein COB36_03335 [Alphaproteobacteria bacterium]
MISMVLPTKNRAHTLRLVATSYFSQECVSEIIFVNDAGVDDTRNILENISKDFPDVTLKIHDNPKCVGASEARNIGASLASNDYILFCDDDEYMEQGYAKTCLNKLKKLDAGAVSGRRVYMRDNESCDEALERFGHGMRRSKPMNYIICELVNGAIYTSDQSLPFTNAIILTRKDLLEKFPFDSFYARGNGYREETDYQMNLFVNGYDIYVTNDCHTMHLPLSQVKTGGQRVKRFKRIYWSIYYTRYFFNKYYDRYAKRVGVKVPKQIALFLFSCFAIYKELLRPTLYNIAMSALKFKRSITKG